MKIPMGDMTVYFPYDYVYPEQYDYMLSLKETLDQGGSGHCLLEMPTGTGKTVSLLSLIVSYQIAKPEIGKLVYCTRTVQEMDKVMEEIKRVFKYIHKVFKKNGNTNGILSFGNNGSSGSNSNNKLKNGNVGNIGNVGNVADIEDMEDVNMLNVNGSGNVASSQKLVKAGKSIETDTIVNPHKNLCVCLSARRNLCIHPQVSQFDDRSKIDALCRNRTASWVRSKYTDDNDNSGKNGKNGNNSNNSNNSASRPNKSHNNHLCDYYEGYNANGTDANLYGIYSLDDLKKLGAQHRWCPYFLSRHLITLANIVVYNYQYMLDPKISNLVSKDLSKDCIVVFDEAHNIDNICIEALSVRIDKRTLHTASKNLNELNDKVAVMTQTDKERLNQEYQALVKGLLSANLGLNANNNNNNNSSSSNGNDSNNSNNNSNNNNNNNNNNNGNNSNNGNNNNNNNNGNNSNNVNNNNNNNNSNSALTDILGGNPVLSDDILQQSVPGNIRKARHFLNFLKTLIEHLRQRMTSESVTVESSVSFINAFRQMTNMNGNQILALKFCHDRLASLFRTLQIADLDTFTPLTTISNFASLVGTYDAGFQVLITPFDERTPNIRDPILRLCCQDASIAMKPVLTKFRNVIITSGTLSPMDFYPKILRFEPRICRSFDMTLSRECICPMMITKGNDQIPMTTKWESRKDASVIKNYGEMLTQMAEIIPDGIVCFFTSYAFMEEIVSEWSRMRILHKINEKKLVFIETRDIVETSLALESYKKACDVGRGAIFLSVARGKVAEGIDFDGHYGRCVILFGVPFQYSRSRVLMLRLAFIKEEFGISENDFLAFDALRQAAQCVGRVIRSKLDYGLMIFADLRYTKADKRKKLPQWLKTYLKQEYVNLSTDVAMEIASLFVKKMAQPHTQKDEIGKSLLSENDLRKRLEFQETEEMRHGYSIRGTSNFYEHSAHANEVNMQQNDDVDMNANNNNNNNNNNSNYNNYNNNNNDNGNFGQGSSQGNGLGNADDNDVEMSGN